MYCAVRLDTLLVHKQVEGSQGLRVLLHKVYAEGPCVLYQGASAAFAAQLLGHFTWFGVYNVRSAVPQSMLPLCGNGRTVDTC